MRFGNALFEPLWRRETIANIQITIAEELGVETRGAFYDQTGALRDMVQNHALQLLCAIGMEPPINASANAIRDEKLKVLQSLKPWSPDTIGQHVVRGQYAAGTRQGQAVAGYLQESGVAPGSTTETFVALRTEIPTGAGRACHFSSAPANAWPAATPTSWSTSGPCPTRFSRPLRALPTAW
jgi:glucose-6-phosphate 1-dehydrogenase (EC 1.1.1.49)